MSVAFKTKSIKGKQLPAHSVSINIYCGISSHATARLLLSNVLCSVRECLLFSIQLSCLNIAGHE